MNEEALIQFLETLNLDNDQMEEAIAYINATSSEGSLVGQVDSLEDLRTKIALEDDPQKRIILAARIMSLELGPD